MKFPVLWSGLCCYTEGWGGKCSEILATIKLLYNPRVNKVFTSLHTTLDEGENWLYFLVLLIIWAAKFCAANETPPATASNNLLKLADERRTKAVKVSNGLQTSTLWNPWQPLAIPTCNVAWTALWLAWLLPIILWCKVLLSWSFVNGCSHI